MTLFLLLTPEQTTAVMTAGMDVVGGRVVPEDEAGYADADAARADFARSHPTPGRGRFVDFLLLPERRGMRVADGLLEPTRVPAGASFHRFEADGTRVLVSWFDTPAYGWRNARGDVRPTALAGPWATFEGADFVAAFDDDPGVVHLVATGGEPPEGFGWTKVGVSRRTVGVQECESLWEPVVTGRLGERRVRVLELHGETAVVWSGTPTTVARADLHDVEHARRSV